MSQRAKLAELRARTDRDLPALIERELDRALTLAEVAENRGAGFHAAAELTYQKLTVLLLKASGISPKDRARMESKLKELRFLLEHGPAMVSTARSAAGFAEAD